MSGAYEQKDNQVYFHLQQTTHRLDIPLRSNYHFRGDCQKAEGHTRLSGTHGFATFTLLYKWKLIALSHVARRGVPSINNYYV
jgi:hypothetical protein